MKVDDCVVCITQDRYNELLSYEKRVKDYDSALSQHVLNIAQYKDPNIRIDSFYVSVRAVNALKDFCKIENVGQLYEGLFGVNLVNANKFTKRDHLIKKLMLWRNVGKRSADEIVDYIILKKI